MPVERPKDLIRRIGTLDIETSDFKADIGYMLSWCIKDYGGVIHSDVITQKEVLNGKFDKRITGSLLDKMADYDMLITYYGTGFDMPFIRTRGVINGFSNVLTIGDNIHFDLYYVIRNKFKIRRNSLKIATATLLGKTNKTDVDINVWKRARLGHKESLDYVMEHNEYDVIDTEKLYDLAVKYRRKPTASV
jgi:uncharacterized protein YprB with RNaseH-like and TPR domain